MSQRRGPHNGRDLSGNFEVKQEDVDDLHTEQNGQKVIREEVRLGGAVEDIGPNAGAHGEHITELVDANRDDVARVIGKVPRKRKR